MFFFGVFDGGFNNKTYSFNISVYLCNPLSMLIPLLCYNWRRVDLTIGVSSSLFCGKGRGVLNE